MSNAPLVHAALLVLLPRAAAAQIVRPLLRWPGRRLSPLLRRLTARIPQQPQGRRPLVVVDVAGHHVVHLLLVLTGGVGFLSYKSWQDDKNSEKEAAGLKSTLELGFTGGGNTNTKGKPVLSKVGKGFAKVGGGQGKSLTSGESTTAAGKGKDLEDLKEQAMGAILPEGWAAFIDEETGDPYYYNDTTKETKWDRPS